MLPSAARTRGRVVPSMPRRFLFLVVVIIASQAWPLSLLLPALPSGREPGRSPSSDVLMQALPLPDAAQRIDALDHALPAVARRRRRPRAGAINSPAPTSCCPCGSGLVRVSYVACEPSPHLEQFRSPTRPCRRSPGASTCFPVLAIAAARQTARPHPEDVDALCADEAGAVTGRVLAAIAIAWAAGGGVVALAWPRQHSLPWIAWLALAGLVGPFTVGAALLIGRERRRAGASLGAGHRCARAGRRRLGRDGDGGSSYPWPRGRRALVMVTLVLADRLERLDRRTHASRVGRHGRLVPQGAHPRGEFGGDADGDPRRSDTLLDRARLPAARPAGDGVGAVVAAGRGRAGDEGAARRVVRGDPAAGGRGRARAIRVGLVDACAAVMVVASTPRLLIGEGSFTSGYGDGPLAGLLAALVWLLWRSDQAADARGCRCWRSSRAALACDQAGRRRWPSWSRPSCVRGTGGSGAGSVFAGPAWRCSRLAGVDHGAGAPSGMAYEWHGVATSLARLGPIVDGLPVRVGRCPHVGTFVAGLAVAPASSGAVACRARKWPS